MLKICFIFFTIFATFASGFVRFDETPLDVVAAPGDTVFFNCKTNLSTDESFGWLHDGVPIQTGLEYRVSRDFLSFELSKDKLGEYQCVGGGGLFASLPGKLSEAKLEDFSSQNNEPVRALSGNDLLIDCLVPSSNPSGFITYYKDNKQLETGNFELINGELLFLRNVDSRQSGNYSCSIQNHITGQKKRPPKPITVSVINRGTRKEKSAFIYKPKDNYIVRQGDSLTIPCIASGNPKPEVSWTRFGNQGVSLPIPSSHGLLRVIGARISDSGTYICSVYNGARRFLRRTNVQVITPPIFLETPTAPNQVIEGSSLKLSCEGSGNPKPTIKWYHNGSPILLKEPFKSNGSSLFIQSVSKELSGVYQCFLNNQFGANSSWTFLKVKPLSDDEFDDYYFGEHALVLPPSKPNVSQFSKDSVMLTWNLPAGSIPVSFYKIQFREFQGKKRSEWKTLDDIIPPESRKFEVLGMDKDKKYRFRIVAAYANNDSKPGALSKKFKFDVKTQPTSSPLVAPIITRIYPIGVDSLRIGWKLENPSKVEGYFVHYRSYGNYEEPFKKITIIGGSSHSFVLEDLIPGLTYEIKVQSFNLRGLSPFSKLARKSTLQYSTVKSLRMEESTTTTQTPDYVDNESVTYYLIIGTGLASLLLLVIMGCSIAGYYQKKKATKSFSDTNVAIHEKYMDASLARHSKRDREVPPMSETSFSTRQDEESREKESSHPIGLEDYADEPSGLSWRRMRISESMI